MKRYQLFEITHTNNTGVIDKRSTIKEVSDGAWIKYADHEAELSRLNAKISELEKTEERYKSLRAIVYDPIMITGFEQRKEPNSIAEFDAFVDRLTAHFAASNVPGNK